MIIHGIKTISNTLLGRRKGLSPQTGGVAMNKKRTQQVLRQHGFEIVDCGAEGTLLGNDDPFISGRYMGLVSAFDVLARKL